MEWAARYVPLMFAIGFISILLGARGMGFRYRFGYSPFHFPRSDDHSAAAFLSRMLAVCLAAIVLLGVAAAVTPQWLERLDPMYRIHGGATLITGVVLVCLATALVWRAQQEMGDAWRVGIDPTQRTGLVTHGLFQFCRNPIYLGLQIGLCGFFGLVPGYFMVALLAVAAVLFQVQARLEESHLAAQHGEPYLDYGRRVGRFLLWTGRFTTTKAVPEPDQSKS